MTYIVTYRAGEKRCEVCHDPLGEIKCSRSKRHFQCDKPSCLQSFGGSKPVPVRTVKLGERTCDMPGCDHPIPPGPYPRKRDRFFCSKLCTSRWYNRNGMVTYKAGEKRCQVCDDPLEEIRCSACRKHFVCAKPGCSYSKDGKRRVRAQIVHPGERVCAGSKGGKPCGKPVPPGSFSPRQKKFFCSDRCRAGQKQWSQVVKCAYCGSGLKRSPSALKKYKVFFCSPAHNGEYLKRLALPKCGRFIDLYEQFGAQFADIHYRSKAGANTARAELRQFFEFLTREEVLDINLVTPSHISDYIAERRITADYPRADLVKVMFDYFAEIGLHIHPNPVRPRIHYVAQKESEPRPFSPEEMDDIWRWLEERGDTRAKVAIAFGEEFGPRGGEVCNVRVQDVDLRRRRIWIRNPTKNLQAGWAPFSDKTEKWLTLWLTERPECDHDFLLTNGIDDPMNSSSLRYLLSSILCKKFLNHTHAEGLVKWSYHRMRHTNATLLNDNGVDLLTNMAIHRWKDPKSAKKYTKILTSSQAVQYHTAIQLGKQKEEQRKSAPPPPRPMSLDEHLANRRKKAA